jgi:DNA-binding transcriptional LysR family regulator
MSSMFAWDDARYFLALHRAGSLSAAARELKINQSTVGRRLAALEASIGARVFFRSREGYRLSPAGERLLTHVERMEEEAIAAARRLVGGENQLTGPVRITTPDVLGPRVVVPMMTKFRARHPKIDIEVDADERVRNLAKREADLAIRGGRPTERGVVVRKLAPFVCTAYASRAYIAARGMPRGGGFDGHDLIQYPEAMAGLRDARWLAQRAPRAHVAFRSGSTYARLHAAAAGLGIASLPCYLGDEDESLVRVVDPSDGLAYDIWLVIHQDLQSAGRVRACADHLVNEFKAQGARLAGRCT